MGDLRNKIAKIERAQAEKAAGDAWLRARAIDPNPPRRPPPSEQYPKCACGLTIYETTVYQCGKDGYFCVCCMPWKWKRELIGHMTNVGLNYDADEHGEPENRPPDY